MLGDRVFSIANRIGQTQRNMADLLGFSETTLSKWRTRTDKAPDTSSYQTVSRILLRDCGWLMGDDDAPEWSPRMRKVQDRLRAIAKEQKRGDLPSVRERLLFIHRHLLEMLPDLDPRMWAWHLRWDVKDWERFVTDPEFLPGEAQLKGAAEITTIPARWFIDGNTDCLEDMPPEELQELGRLLRSLNMDVVDAKRELTKRRTPRQ